MNRTPSGYSKTGIQGIRSCIRAGFSVYRKNPAYRKSTVFRIGQPKACNIWKKLDDI